MVHPRVDNVVSVAVVVVDNGRRVQMLAMWRDIGRTRLIRLVVAVCCSSRRCRRGLCDAEIGLSVAGQAIEKVMMRMMMLKQLWLMLLLQLMLLLLLLQCLLLLLLLLLELIL